jgi:hypothetical protein
MMGRTRVVWNFFSISDGKKQIAKCNLCKTLMSCKTTVSNLKKTFVKKTSYSAIIPRKGTNKK